MGLLKEIMGRGADVYREVCRTNPDLCSSVRSAARSP
jgi:hypothetical protein